MTKDTASPRLGASESDYEKEKGASQGKFLKIEEGDNIHRVVKGFTVSTQVFLPTLITNEANELVQTVRVMDVPKPNAGFYDTLIGKIINASWAVQKKHGKDWSPINVNRRASAVVFDINEDMEDNDTGIPTLQIASYPISVVKDDRTKTGLLYLQKQETVSKPVKLVNGPMFAWNAVITKNIDATKSSVRGTSYTVRVMTEDDIYAEFSNKLPLEALDSKWEGYDELFELVYTDAQKEALSATFEEKNNARKNTYQPLTTHEDMLKFFEEYPLDLTSEDSEGNAKFPHAEELMEAIHTMGVKMIEGKSEIEAANGQLKEGSDEESDKIDEAEETEHEVVDEEKEKEKETVGAEQDSESKGKTTKRGW